MDSPHVARDRRQRRDACWAVSFLVVATSAIALGIAGSMTTPSGSDVRVDWRALRGGDACTVGDDAAWAEVLDANRERIAANERRTTARLGLGAGKGYGRRSSMMLGQSSGSTTSAASGPEAIDAKAMFAKVWPWVLVAFAGAFGLGILLMHALKNHSKTVVWGVMYSKVAMLATLTVLSAIQMAGTMTILLGVFTALSVLILYLWKDELNLVASMIAVSTQSLKDNPHLVSVTVMLQLITLVYAIPLVYLSIDASQHGQAVVNQYATARATGACTGYYLQSVDCCSWKLDSWVGAYYFLVCFAAIWAFSVALEFRMYVIGGVVSQWYFAPAGTTNFKGTTKTSVNNALGPSFGTICYGGFVITIIEMLKRAAEKWRRENRGNILVCCLVMCLDCIYALIEYISRFAMIQASMTGEAFCDAARTVSDLLSRNFLLAYGSYVFPQSILGFTVLVLSAFFGYNAYLLSSFGYDIADDTASANTSSIVIGVLCFVVSYIVLNFFIMILLNVIDAVFVCYAVDKDRSAVNHPELHQVFDEVTAKQRAREEEERAAMGEPLQSGKTTKYASM